MAHNIRIKSTETLSNQFSPLEKVTYEFENNSGKTEELSREVYCTKNVATALLYNIEKGSVILTRQFRLPAYLNNHGTGMLVEACAGLVNDGEDAQAAIIREIEEETGYKVKDVTKLFELFSTPGAVKELLHFFVADYSSAEKISEGGGLAEEHEEIEVLEIPFAVAFNKIESEEIQDTKTVLLLQYARLYLFK